MAGINDAVAYAFADSYSGSGDWLNEGTGGATHDGTISGAAFYKPDATNGQFARMVNVASNTLTTPDATKFDITDNGDIDIRVRVALDDWTPATTNTIVAKYASSHDGWGFQVVAGGMRGAIGDGSGAFPTSSGGALGFSNGTTQGIRMTYDSSATMLRFYTLDDPDDDLATGSWTQNGTASGFGKTTTTNNTVSLDIGSYNNGGTAKSDGDFYEVLVYDGIAGTLVVDWKASDYDSTDIDAGTHTDNQSNVWTLAQAVGAAGTEWARLVWRAHFFFDNNDDHITLSDNAALDFGTTDDFTIGVAFSTLDVTPGTDDTLISKRNGNTTEAGWGLHVDTTGIGQFGIGDGTNGPNDQTGALTDGNSHTLIGVRNTGDDDIEIAIDGTMSGSATTDSTTATLANANDVRIGTEPDASNDFHGEIWAYAIIPQALTDGEVATLHTNLIDQVATVDDTATPATIVATVTMPAPTVGISTNPATIVATVSMDAPTLTYGWTITATTIVATVTMDAPTVLSTNTITPATIVAVVTMDTPTHIGAPLPTAQLIVFADTTSYLEVLNSTTTYLTVYANDTTYVEVTLE